MLEVFAIRDVKTGGYSTPFYQLSHADAVRYFSRGCNDPNLNLYHFPSDYELFYFGKFNPVTGKYDLLQNPEFIVSALSLNKQLKDIKEAISDVSKSNIK